jgi:outer membrane protein assembly factor BamB
MHRNRAHFIASWFTLVVSCFPSAAADQPQWGQAWLRNMVSEERGLPDSFDPKTGKNVKWTAELGTETHSTPIVARGRVYIGTNNGHPRDPNEQGDRGVLMCFDEKTGRFLWQLAVPKREEDIYFDWPKSGIASPATVEGDRLYLVSNRGEVLCLDLASTSPKDACPVVLWRFNLTTEAGIWSHDAAHSSILIHGEHLYLNTGTGVDNTHKRIRTPDAPSLVVLDKRTGKLLARDNEHIAPNIFHSTWCSPSLGKVNGRELLFFAAGNGIVYAFQTISGAPTLQHSNPPADLSCVWRFDFDPGAPKTNVHQYNSNRRESPTDFYGMPVFDHNRLYVAGGGDIWWGKTEAWLKCIDTTKTGDITTNGLVWSYPLQKHVLSTPAVYNGMVFIADCGHTVHCVDAQSGKPYWTETVDGEVWASPLVADGKVYLGTRSGGFYVFAADKEKKLLSSVELHDPISATVTAANHTLFLATMNHLYAIGHFPP